MNMSSGVESETESPTQYSQPSAALYADGYQLEECQADGRTANRKQRIAEVAERIRSLYDQGVPFFKKSVFQDITCQLDKCSAKGQPVHRQVISIPALDGTMVEVKLESGGVMRNDDETEFVMMDPSLNYRTFQHLSAYDNPESFSEHLAYCPTTIAYPLVMRRISTKLPVSPWKRMSLEELQTAFNASIQMWEDSEACKQLRSLLKSASIPDVSNIIAFACSSMTRKDLPPKAACQHALILTLRSTLESMQPGKPEIKCFAQDPAYTKEDEEVLRRAGITPLEDPQAFLKVDDQSVVISFSPNIPVRQIVADIARPAILIWDTVRDEGEIEASWTKSGLEYSPARCTDPVSSRLRDMIQNDYVLLTDLSPEESFNWSSVYVRRG